MHARSHASDDPHDQHAHASTRGVAAFRASSLLNLGLVLVEAAVGLAIGSMSLIADAGHNAIDVLGLVLAWLATRLALRRPTTRHTYGMARSTILAALLNATLLLFACGALVWESVLRLQTPQPIPGTVMMLVAAVALAVNAGSAAMFWRQRREDLNARGAFLHLAADAGVSLMVIVAGGLIWLSGWYWIDPLAGILIACVILGSGWGLLRDSLDLALDAVPRGLDAPTIHDALRAIEGVNSVHDLHIWPLSTTVTALTAHLEHDGTRATDELLAEAQALLRQRFAIEHTTIQFENAGCGQRC